MKKQASKAAAAKPFGLILLCWLVYTCSYIGKLSYNANINPIGDAFGISYAEAGMVSTFFFFAYGGGQVFNGLMCKRYNVKYVILTCLTVSSILNLAVTTVSDFSVLKYLWLLNGVSMSFLWTLLIRLLSETLSEKDIPRAIFFMGTTVATGTFLVYGMSALFVAALSWRVTFYVASGILLSAAVVWFCLYDSLVTPLKRARDRERQECLQAEGGADDAVRGGGTGLRGLGAMLAVLAWFAVSNNFVKDGITAWTPDILSALYGTPAWLSILLTLLLPMVAIGGTAIAVRLYARTKSFVGTSTLLFVGAGVLIGAVMGFLQTSLIPLTVGCLALVSCLMAGVNNVITSMAPLHMKERVNSGKLAGILNGFCYLGSTLTSYSLGAVADAWGWYSVFVVLLTVSVIAVGIGCVYLMVKRFSRLSC